MAPAALGGSVPVALGAYSAAYMGRVESGIQKIPLAMVSSPVLGKFPGLRTN
jgi:hypothetical protein